MHNRVISIRYDVPGHEGEYVVTIGGFGMTNYIPYEISDEIQSALPDTYVLNRGSRIEVVTDNQELTEVIYNVVTKALQNYL